MNDIEEVGALWLKEGKNGKYLSGKIGEVKVLVFKNNYKEPGDNKPYYTIHFEAGTVMPMAATEPANTVADEIPF